MSTTMSTTTEARASAPLHLLLVAVLSAGCASPRALDTPTSGEPRGNPTAPDEDREPGEPAPSTRLGTTVEGRTVLEPLGIQLRLPPGVTVSEMSPGGGGKPPHVRVVFPGAGSLKLTTFDDGYLDPLANQRKVAHGPSAPQAKDKRVLLDAPDAVLYESDSPLLGGRCCTVTACSGTTPSYCVFAASGVVVRGEVMKLSDEQCWQVVEMVRSVRAWP